MLSLERVVIATMETMATTSTMIAAEPNSGTTAPFTISIMTSSVYCMPDPCCALMVYNPSTLPKSPPTCISMVNVPSAFGDI